MRSHVQCEVCWLDLRGKNAGVTKRAMIGGLLVMDPSLTIMIVTKENVAAHAFVKHFLRLGLPESINCLVGRALCKPQLVISCGKQTHVNASYWKSAPF